MASKVVTIVGNLAGDPELRRTQSGAAVASFTIVSSDRVRVPGSNPVEYQDGPPLFMRCSIWNEYAEHVAESLSKGSRVIATGDLKQDTWETKEGEKRSSVELNVSEMGPVLRFAVARLERRVRGAAAPAESVQPAPSGRRAAPVPEGQPF